MTSMVLCFFFYLVSIWMFLSSSSCFMFWLFMEVNLIMMVFLSYKMDCEFSLGCKMASMFSYFIIQSIGSIMFLSSLIFFEFPFFFNDIFFVLGLCLKIGLFPVFFWIFSLSGSLSIFVFSLILTFQKIPLFLLLFFNSSFLIDLFLICSLVLGSLLIVANTSLIGVVVSSSIASSYLSYILFSKSLILFFSFFLFYFFFLYFSLKSGSDFFFILFFVFLSGLPPLSMFFFKLFSLEFFFSDCSYFEICIFWASSFLSLLGYTKFFFPLFFLRRGYKSGKFLLILIFTSFFSLVILF